MGYLLRKGEKVSKRASHIDLTFRTSLTVSVLPYHTQCGPPKHPSLEGGCIITEVLSSQKLHSP